MEKFLIEPINNHPVFRKSSKEKIHIAKCPGRLSFSKHCDYVNNDLLYLASDLFTYAAVQLIIYPSSILKNTKIKIANLNPEFSDTEIEFHRSDNLDIAKYKEHWSFYLLKALCLLKDYGFIRLDKILEINIVINSNLKAAAGMSSSHALILSSTYSLVKAFQSHNLITTEGEEFFKILLNSNFPAELNLNDEKILALLKFYQEIEIAKGFNSGLGDQAAQLLARKSHFCFVKLFPKLNYSYISIPEDISFMILPSFIKAEKSSSEYQQKVKYFKEYKEVNKLAQSLEQKAKYIADLRDYLDDSNILRKLKNAFQNPDDTLPYLALYALAEGARLKNLKNNFSIEALAKHLNSSHLAEWISAEPPSTKIFPLQIDFPEEIFKAQEFINPERTISEHLGAYRASTEFNDALHRFSLNLDGVLGSSIMGAGLGGNNLAIVNTDKADQIKDLLLKNFYSHYNLEKKAVSDISIHSGSSGLEYLGEF